MINSINNVMNVKKHSLITHGDQWSKLDNMLHIKELSYI